MCQQSFKQKCTAFGDSLKEIRDNVPDQQQLSQPEVADVYGAQLDALNAKYERLLSHFQQLIDNAKGIDADREVSHCGHENVCHLHGSLKKPVVMVERKTSLERDRAAKLPAMSVVRKLTFAKQQTEPRINGCFRTRK
jgi:hypothetical protein